MTTSSSKAEGSSTHDGGGAFAHEGLWTHVRCLACDAIVELEDDRQRGEHVTCDACGAEGVIE